MPSVVVVAVVVGGCRERYSLIRFLSDRTQGWVTPGRGEMADPVDDGLAFLFVDRTLNPLLWEIFAVCPDMVMVIPPSRVVLDVCSSPLTDTVCPVTVIL